MIVEGKYNGFCFGVECAINAVQQQLQSHDVVYTYGPIIHNRIVVERLQDNGALAVDDIAGLPQGATLVIRSHGVPKQDKARFEAAGLHVVDATCPFVERIQMAVQEHFASGEQIIIAGKKDHPEVVGINGYCENSAIIIANAEEAQSVSWQGKAFLVAQTTFVQEEYQRILQLLQSCGDIDHADTICAATRQRQEEAERLAKECDAMVVVGGIHSSNTQKLLQICLQYCENSQIVEDSRDVSVENIPFNGIIGIVAGASTPQWLIREVIARMNEELNNTTGIEEPAEVTEQPVEAVEEQVTEETAVAEPEVAQAETTDAPEEEPAPQAEQTAETTDDAASEEAEPAAEQAEEKPEEPAEEAAVEDDSHLTDEEKFERDLDKTMVRIRNGQVKKGTVVQIVGDDVFVNIGYKADGIIPQNELSTDPKAVAAEILSVGDEVEVEILKVNDGEGNVLLSKKAVDRRKQDKQAVADLEDGRHFDAKIKQAVKGGLLADYKGARVFVPASQVADKYVENLDEYVGKMLTLKALEVDKQRKRIVASHRQVLRDEFVAKKKEKYNEFEAGQRVKGVVRRITDFGAFTDIGGVDGLIHVTDLSWGRVKHPSDIVNVGDEVEVEILSVNADTERIALGYKQLQPKPWDHAAERYLVGDIVEGKVDRMVPFGAFVELEPGLFGLVHISQVATRRIEKVEDELKIGDVITVKVLEVNPETRRISLSRRAVLKPDEEPRQRRERSEDGSEPRERRPRKEREERYEIPQFEQATVSLADFFPQIEIEVVDEATVEEPAAEEPAVVEETVVEETVEAPAEEVAEESTEEANVEEKTEE
ncbi:bifunctional 4-hydroxy-3-methylbut-2-enyl diphosphate reductase/30S ribosomal protein S1 [Eubacteriales bacterium OttesenSCG-928-N14]|nr:bifunctional 4-hydroxy-3-methylbut-2-enyl diphosphate reductase/30S ribosomal protein S1 [Eubacteriales bacterium OttesenSCG-928-N14]